MSLFIHTIIKHFLSVLDADWSKASIDSKFLLTGLYVYVDLYHCIAPIAYSLFHFVGINISGATSL